MKSQPTNRIEEQLKNLFEHYSNGRLVDAERLARSITQETSSNKDAWKALWAILQKTGKVKESLAFNDVSIIRNSSKIAKIRINGMI